MALKLIEREIQDKDLKVEDLNVLLGWHQVKINGTKTQKLSKWQSIRAKQMPPPPYEKWTEDDETKF